VGDELLGGWVGRPVGADVPATTSGPDRADVAAAGDLRDVGVDTGVRWGLWQHLDGIGEFARPRPPGSGAPRGAVAGGLLVTAQRRPGSVEAVPPDTTLVAAYEAGTGAPRRQVEGPRARGELRLPAVGGRLLLAADRLTALDTADGAFAWCVDAAGSVVGRTRSGSCSRRRTGARRCCAAWTPRFGDERWRVGYEAHDSTLQPVVTGGTVVADVVPAGGGASVLQAFDVATGEPRWSAPADPPGDLVGDGDGVLVADVYSASRGVTALDARSGVRRWATPLPGSGPRQLWPVEGGVVVNAQALTLLDAGTGAARWSGPAIEPRPWAWHRPW
jgi:PQQ-like domain